MAQLRQVVVDVVLTVPLNGWTSESLVRTLRSIAAQDAAFTWRVVVIDASMTETVQRIVEATIPAPRLCYEPLHLRTGSPSDMLYQGVNSCRSKYITYVRPDATWRRDHLSMLVAAARQSRSDLVVRGGACLSHQHAGDLFQANFDPCSGGDVLHTAEIYSRSDGWPRGQRLDCAPGVWLSMYVNGAEFFAVALPHDEELVADSTSDGKQMMLFTDA